jgi:hypothetical protein
VSKIKTELQVDNIHVLHDTLVNTPDNFVGGKIQHFYENWSRLTSDKWILNVICGYNIEFENTPTGIQNKEPKELVFNSDETNMVQREIEKCLQKDIIHSVTNVRNQYISNIFVRPTKDGTYKSYIKLKSFKL